MRVQISAFSLASISLLFNSQEFECTAGEKVNENMKMREEEEEEKIQGINGLKEVEGDWWEKDKTH